VTEDFKKRLLIVEGDDDKFAIAQLMSKYTPWSDNKEEAPVKIQVCGSVSFILRKHFIPTTLKSRDVETLGVIIDADENCCGRWETLRRLCIQAFPLLPSEFPSNGLCVDNEEGKRLGIWIMPDNRSRGMIETFMTYLIPAGGDDVWRHAQRSFDEACSLGAKCRTTHKDKANIFTWLAWQYPPGQSLGRAIVQNIFDCKSETALLFVEWFKRLYDLPDLPTSA